MNATRQPAQLAIIPTPEGKLVVEEYLGRLMLVSFHDAAPDGLYHELSPSRARILAHLLLAAAQLQELILDREKAVV